MPNLNKNQQLILEAIRTHAGNLPVDKICELTKLEPQVVNKTITSLIIDDIIHESGGKYLVL